ncbi:Protease HtpX [Novipirellula galeiformis]|uniref:Protease HtpX n=1 Tax=Novipirellula galeiformis TaxID=2528004 RepID=A0A5C6CT58_9BACT|nr:M48 family metalloprotease [Novipirellula galeiformis]TWU26236.1 Protease HtpX [Novipirellula galeiformis]
MNRQAVPKRDALLGQLRRANQYTAVWVAMRVIAIVGLLAFIRWDQVFFAPIVSVTACLIIVGPFAMELLRTWGQRKKRLEDIKDSTRFGDLDKYKLQTLYRETLQRLKLPDERLPVYVTNDKSLNAGAVRLGRLFGRLNGIYLHRQVLHKLRGDEVQAIMGHELGHYYRFYLADQRFRLLTLLLGALLGVFVVQLTDAQGYLGLIIVSATSSAFWFVSGIPTMRHGRAIEHLCDDFGSQVQGIESFISSLLKIGLDEEMRCSIELEVMAMHVDNELLSPAEVAAAVEKSIPYGHAAEPELFDTVTRELKNRTQANRKASLSGFINYLRESDRDEGDLKERLEQQARQLNQIDRLEWESILDDPQDVRLNERQTERLVQLMLAAPEKSLFRTPGHQDGIHPPVALRILYLWQNRNSTTELSL